ncbi:hypothetical protein D918_00970, partial [Trichuris suis]
LGDNKPPPPPIPKPDRGGKKNTTSPVDKDDKNSLVGKHIIITFIIVLAVAFLLLCHALCKKKRKPVKDKEMFPTSAGLKTPPQGPILPLTLPKMAAEDNLISHSESTTDPLDSYSQSSAADSDSKEY